MLTKFARPENVPTARAAPAIDPVDAELREWKKARGSHFPLKLLALVASVSFGLASVVLPAEVNEWAQWPLYALSAASLFVGFRRRKN